MSKYITYGLLLIVAISLMGVVPLSKLKATPQTVGVYEENFTDYTYKAHADVTVDWDVFGNKLSLAAMSGRYQNQPEVAPDNQGGIYVVWEEIYDGSTSWDIYIQRVDESGNRLWPEAVRVHHYNIYGQIKPALATDSQGNAIVIWHDDRDWPINGLPAAVYAQKISSNGDRLWSEDGIKISGNPSHLADWEIHQLAIAIGHDDTAIIVWQGWQDGKPDKDIYAQRVDSQGNLLWIEDIQVNDDLGTSTPQRLPDVAIDHDGNAVVVWVDGRHGGEDIYAQRLNNAGIRLWTNDVLVSDGTAIPHQGDVSIDLDLQGSAVVVWQYGQRRDPVGNSKIYAQKVSTNGQRMWGSAIQANQNSNQTSRDWSSVSVLQSGTAVIVWAGYLDDHHIYVQTLDPDGHLVWDTEKRLTTTSFDRSYVGRIRTDQLDRAYLAWNEWPLSGSNDVMLQQIDIVTGTFVWTDVGVRVDQGYGSTSEIYPDVIANSNGQATVVWGDLRRGDWTVHGLRIDENGDLVWPTSYLVNIDPSTQGWMPAGAGDDSGNVVATWRGRYGIMAQRIDSDGNRQWSSDLIVKENGNWYQDPDIVRSSDGTYYIVWLQHQPDDNDFWNIHAQHIDANGQLLWSTDKRLNRLSYHVRANSPIRPYEPFITVDNENHLIVTWYGDLGSQKDIYVQRVSPNGDLVWSQDIALGAHLPDLGESATHLWPTNTATSVTADEKIYVSWVDNRNGDFDIYMQKVSKTGELLWNVAKRINDDTGITAQRNPVMSMTTDHDLIVAWNDFREGPEDIYAQRFNASGSPMWSSDVKVDQIDSMWASEINISHEPLDYFIITWRTVSQDGSESVYAQRLNADGTVAWNSDLKLTPDGHYYYPQGVTQSKRVNSVSDDIRQALLTADMEINGGEAQFYLTNDGGEHWNIITPGTTHVFTTTGNDLRWKAELFASPAWVSNAPIIDQIRIEYQTDTGEGDVYEEDDTFEQASPLQVGGAVQTHSFSHANDEDWAWFDAVIGTTYILQTSHTGPNADTILDLYDQNSLLLMTDANSFGNDARLIFTAPTTGTYFARVRNNDGNMYGDGTEYDLSVRIHHPNGLAVIVAGHNDSWQLQSNIDYSADLAYLTLLGVGFPKNNVLYLGPDLNRDVDGNGYYDDITVTATLENAHHAIQNWPREHNLSSGVPLYIYLIDHGHYDQFLVNGSAEKITASSLDLWLNNLEATTGADQTTVIIETCKSGSFIDVTNVGLDEISSPNRVVVTSTTSQANAFPSDRGALFSDIFWTALGDNQDVWTAFQMAKTAVDARGLAQTPWLDDNGNAIPDELDGALARGRGLAGIFGGSEPVIDWLTVGAVSDAGIATVTAQVRDDFNVMEVFVEVYPPGYVPPEVGPGETPEVDVPKATLTLAENDQYIATLTGLSEPGAYRIVGYAVDDEENWAVPQWTLVQLGEAIYLPIVTRQ